MCLAYRHQSTEAVTTEWTVAGEVYNLKLSLNEASYKLDQKSWWYKKKNARLHNGCGSEAVKELQAGLLYKDRPPYTERKGQRRTSLKHWDSQRGKTHFCNKGECEKNWFINKLLRNTLLIQPEKYISSGNRKIRITRNTNCKQTTS